MRIQHISERGNEGSITDVFLNQNPLGTGARIVELISGLERVLDMPIWAYEGHNHLVLSFADRTGTPVVSVNSPEVDLYTIILSHQKPIPEISRSGEIRYSGVKLDDAVPLVVELLHLAKSQLAERKEFRRQASIAAENQ